MQNLLHGSTRGENFLCVKMELKQTSTALWNLTDGRILPLFHDYVKDLHIFRIKIITSQPKYLEKKVYSEEGYATSLGWGDILPVILKSDMNADNFYPISGKKLAGLTQLLHLTAFLKFYLLAQIVPKTVSFMDKLVFILTYMLKWKAGSWDRRKKNAIVKKKKRVVFIHFYKLSLTNILFNTYGFLLEKNGIFPIRPASRSLRFTHLCLGSRSCFLVLFLDIGFKDDVTLQVFLPLKIKDDFYDILSGMTSLTFCLSSWD